MKINSYKILDDDYREIFINTYKPYRVLADGTKTYRCLYCNKEIAWGRTYNGEHPLEVDHIIPKTRLRAGVYWNPNRAWNLGPSCKECNSSKSNKLDNRITLGFTNKLKQKYGLISNLSYPQTKIQPLTLISYLVISSLIFIIEVFEPQIKILGYLISSLQNLVSLFIREIKSLT